MILLAIACWLGGSVVETPATTATPAPRASVTPIATPSPIASVTPSPSASATPVPDPSASPVETLGPLPPTPTPPPLVTLATPSVTPAPAAPDGVLTPAQLALHKEAAARLTVIVEETFAEMRRALLANERVTEAGLIAFVAQRLSRDGLVTERRPIVAAGSNGSYPDHMGGSDVAIGRAQVVLVDVMAKKDGPDGVYARTTWVAFTGKKAEIPARVERVWKMVRDAREGALEEMRRGGAGMRAGDADLAARRVIKKQKHAPWFQHGAGESLGGALAGSGAPIRADEPRKLAANACWALRPAVYYPAEFGVRSEVSVCIVAGGVEVTTGVRQREIRPLLD